MLGWSGDGQEGSVKILSTRMYFSIGSTSFCVLGLLKSREIRFQPGGWRLIPGLIRFFFWERRRFKAMNSTQHDRPRFKGLLLFIENEFSVFGRITRLIGACAVETERLQGNFHSKTPVGGKTNWHLEKRCESTGLRAVRRFASNLPSRFQQHLHFMKV